MLSWIEESRTPEEAGAGDPDLGERNQQASLLRREPSRGGLDQEDLVRQMRLCGRV